MYKIFCCRFQKIMYNINIKKNKTEKKKFLVENHEFIKNEKEKIFENYV